MFFARELEFANNMGLIDQDVTREKKNALLTAIVALLA